MQCGVRQDVDADREADLAAHALCGHGHHGSRLRANKVRLQEWHVAMVLDDQSVETGFRVGVRICHPLIIDEGRGLAAVARATGQRTQMDHADEDPTRPAEQGFQGMRARRRDGSHDRGGSDCWITTFQSGTRGAR